MKTGFVGAIGYMSLQSVTVKLYSSPISTTINPMRIDKESIRISQTNLETLTKCINECTLISRSFWLLPFQSKGWMTGTFTRNHSSDSWILTFELFWQWEMMGIDQTKETRKQLTRKAPFSNLNASLAKPHVKSLDSSLRHRVSLPSFKTPTSHEPPLHQTLLNSNQSTYITASAGSFSNMHRLLEMEQLAQIVSLLFSYI
jgi:hypothetical protein